MDFISILKSLSGQGLTYQAEIELAKRQFKAQSETEEIQVNRKQARETLEAMVKQAEAIAHAE